MDQRIQHAFVNKPFYKRFHKCAECKNRKMWTQIAKCTRCKTYCHRRCIQLDSDRCCKPNPIESTAQITDPNLETVVTRSTEEDSKIVLLPEDGIRDLGPAESEVVTDRPENSANVSCAEVFEIAERRPYVPDDGNLEAGTGQQDEYPEGLKDATARPSDDVMTADECGTVLADEEVQVDGHMPTPSDDHVMTAKDCSVALSNEEVKVDEPMLTPSDDHVMTADECGAALSNEEVQVDEPMPTPSDDHVMTAEDCSVALSNEEVHTNPTRDGDASKLAPHRLPCAETEVDERRQNDDNGFERNKCSGDEGVPKDVAEEKKLDQPL